PPSRRRPIDDALGAMYVMYVHTSQREALMPYVDPAAVDSPKGRVRKVSVLFDTGPAAEESWSAAELEWDGRTVLGLRWNGSERGAPIGSPQSRGHPT